MCDSSKTKKWFFIVFKKKRVFLVNEFPKMAKKQEIVELKKDLIRRRKIQNKKC